MSLSLLETSLESLQQKMQQVGSPELLSLEQSDNKISLSLFIPEDLSWFKGHFPEQAVLPGVVQLHWVGLFSQLLFDSLSTFKVVNNLKYKQMVLPNTELNLVLEYNADKQKVAFVYENEDERFSSGSLQF